MCGVAMICLRAPWRVFGSFSCLSEPGWPLAVSCSRFHVKGSSFSFHPINCCSHYIATVRCKVRFTFSWACDRNLIIHLCPVEPSVWWCHRIISVTLRSGELSTAAVLKWTAVVQLPSLFFFIAKSSGRWYFAYFIRNEWSSVQLILWPQSLFQLLSCMFVSFFLVFPPLILIFYGILYADFYWLVCIPVLIVLIILMMDG